MTVDNHHSFRGLSDALQRLYQSPGLAAAKTKLAANVESVQRQIGKAVLADVAAFSVSQNPTLLPELAHHAGEHSTEILRLLGGGALEDFKFVSDHAERRAEQRFPLEATLHAYRCGHKVFSLNIRNALIEATGSLKQSQADSASKSGSEAKHAKAFQQVVAAVADFSLEYTDAVSTVAASAYVAQTRLIANLEGNQRTELMTILLEGYDEADGRVAQVLRDTGYLARRQSFCIALAHSLDPSEMLNSIRARRMLNSIDSSLQKSGLRHLIDLHRNKVTIVFSGDRRRSGWTAPHTALAEKVGAALARVGNAALIGISKDVPSTAMIPSAYKEAHLALTLATADNRVMEFAKMPTLKVMRLLAGDELQRVLPHWTGALFEADRKLKGALAGTLQAYADTSMNVLKAAEKLAIHPNTIYARLTKIENLTGLDAKSYHGLTELLIVLDCLTPSNT